MVTRADVIAFVEKFKDDILLPVAEVGGLDAETVRDAVTIYLDELEQQEAASRIVSITRDGNWRELHPLTSMPFEVLGKKFASVTHYRYAVRYFGADDDCAEYIMEAKTPEIALRRGEEALNVGKTKREDWEYSEEENLKTAYKTLLTTDKILLDRLRATTSSIEFPNTTDGTLGLGLDGKGKNILPKILRELRKELK